MLKYRTWAVASALAAIATLGAAPPAALGQYQENFDTFKGQLCGVAGWEEWVGSVDVCGALVPNQASSPPFAMQIIGNVGGIAGLGDDTVQRFPSYSGGTWTFRLRTFVPIPATGAAYVLLLNTYDDPPGSPIGAYRWSLQVRLDADANAVISDPDGGNAPLIRGQWIDLRADINLDGDSVDISYNGVRFVTGKSWVNGVSTGGLPRIQALDLYAGEPASGGTSGVLFDDIFLARAARACACDINADGTLNSQDFFDFLGAFFGGLDLADFNADGVVNSQDFFDFLGCFFSGCPTDPVQRFMSPDLETADSGYTELYHMGAGAIPLLLEIADAPGLFAGSAHHNPASSVGGLDDTPLGLTALYLIDAILRELHAPHYAVRLLTDDALPAPEALAIAISEYRSWWKRFGGLPLDQLRRTPYPLSTGPVQWDGPLVEIAAAMPKGMEEAGSSTPSPKTPCVGIDGPDAGNVNDPYAWVYPATNAGGPTPYNCLAWAMKNTTDRWLWPVDGDANATPNKILEAYNYNTTSVDCADECPKGRGPKVMFVWHEQFNPPNLDAKNMVHAMVQDADGNWTSKNGMSTKHTGITDTTAFLDKHYPVPAGRHRETRCYCR